MITQDLLLGITVFTIVLLVLQLWATKIELKQAFLNTQKYKKLLDNNQDILKTNQYYWTLLDTEMKKKNFVFGQYSGDGTVNMGSLRLQINKDELNEYQLFAIIPFSVLNGLPAEVTSSKLLN
jgi:hypothetical protein